MPLFVTYLSIGIRSPVMDLSQGSLQGFRNRQSQMGCVLQNAYTLITQIEEDHRCPDHTSRSNDLHINDVGDANQKEDQHLPANSLKSHMAGQLLVRHGTHNACKIIHHRKQHQGDEQAVTSPKEVPKPSAHSRKDQLDHVPEFFHNEIPRFPEIKRTPHKSADCRFLYKVS